jgi:acyl-CoA thioester hydrolase
MFIHRLRVAYRDVTAGNHVYHSRYLDWLEVARNEAFREMGCPILALQDRGILFPVVESALKHHGMARYDDEVEIRTSVAKVGGASLVLDYRVLRGGNLLLEASTRHAVTDLHAKPMRMPSELRQALSRHLTSSSPA